MFEFLLESPSSFTSPYSHSGSAKNLSLSHSNRTLIHKMRTYRMGHTLSFIHRVSLFTVVNWLRGGQLFPLEKSRKSKTDHEWIISFLQVRDLRISRIFNPVDAVIAISISDSNPLNVFGTHVWLKFACRVVAIHLESRWDCWNEFQYQVAIQIRGCCETFVMYGTGNWSRHSRAMELCWSGSVAGYSLPAPNCCSANVRATSLSVNSWMLIPCAPSHVSPAFKTTGSATWPASTHTNFL